MKTQYWFVSEVVIFFFICLAVGFTAGILFAGVRGTLIADIQYPAANSLVRGDVPIYGIAGGEDFKGYIIEYGKGENPDVWILIEKSREPRLEGIKADAFISKIGPVYGNLATWETGLTNYYYDDYSADLEGLYTLRLTVNGRSMEKAEDRVTVVVGRAVTNVFGGVAASSDKKVFIEVPERALYETAIVMSVSAVDLVKIELLVNPPLKRISEIYEVRPSAYKFARDISFKIKTDSNMEGLGIYEYDLLESRWKYIGGINDNDYVSAKLKKLAGGRSYYALLQDYKRKNNEVSAGDEKALIKNMDGACLVLNDFEKDQGGWREDCDTRLEVVNEGKDNGQCLRLTNLNCPGYFSSVVYDDKFSAKEYPIIEFDYKISRDVNISFYCLAANKWYEIGFTDSPKSYLRNNIKKIGQIDGVIRDNNWHHAKFNIYGGLGNQTAVFEIGKIVIADYDSSGYMDLRPGTNRSGSSFCIDNFIIRKQGDQEEGKKKECQGNYWELGIDDGSSDEFCYEKYEGAFKDSETPDDFYVGQPYGMLERAVAFDDPVVNIYFILDKTDLITDYFLYLDICGCDIRNKGYVGFDVLLNDKKIGNSICAYSGGDIFTYPVKKNILKPGTNKLTLRWREGDNWITWDYIKFSPGS